jgi:hypothetical protein
MNINWIVTQTSFFTSSKSNPVYICKKKSHMFYIFQKLKIKTVWTKQNILYLLFKKLYLTIMSNLSWKLVLTSCCFSPFPVIVEENWIIILSTKFTSIITFHFTKLLNWVLYLSIYCQLNCIFNYLLLFSIVIINKNITFQNY